jgi:hypothetical protein
MEDQESSAVVIALSSDIGRGRVAAHSAMRLPSHACDAEVVDIRSAPSAHERLSPGPEGSGGGAGVSELRQLSERSTRLVLTVVRLATSGPRALGDPNLGLLVMHIAYRVSVVNAGWSTRPWSRLQ